MRIASNFIVIVLFAGLIAEPVAAQNNLTTSPQSSNRLPTLTPSSNLRPSNTQQPLTQVPQTQPYQQRFYSAEKPGSDVRFIAFGPMKKDKKESLREDAAILGHLISKSLQLRKMTTSLGINIPKQYGKNEIIYVEGKGLVYVYKVGIQLAPPPSHVQQNSLTAEQNEKDVWGDAKAKVMARPKTAAFQAYQSNTLAPYSALRGGTYSEDIANKLKGNMLEALSHVGNIRELSQSDSVTVLVYGPVNPSGTISRMTFQVNLSDAGLDKTVAQSKIQSIAYIAKANTASGIFLQQSLPRYNTIQSPNLGPRKDGRMTSFE